MHHRFYQTAEFNSPGQSTKKSLKPLVAENAPRNLIGGQQGNLLCSRSWNPWPDVSSRVGQMEHNYWSCLAINQSIFRHCGPFRFINRLSVLTDLNSQAAWGVHLKPITNSQKSHVYFWWVGQLQNNNRHSLLCRQWGYSKCHCQRREKAIEGWPRKTQMHGKSIQRISTWIQHKKWSEIS